MESLVAANLRSRPTRTIISILAVAQGVILMLIIGGIVTGTLNDYLERNISVGADYILQPSGATVFYALTGGTLPEKLAGKLLEVSGVAAVTPVLAKFSSADFGLVFGIDMESFDQFSGRLLITQGRKWEKPYEVIVDQLYARSHNLSPGMTITLLNHEFTVAGICRPGAVVRVFVPLKTLQEMNGTPDKATIMFIKKASDAPSETVFEQLRHEFQGYALIRTTDHDSLLSDARMPGFKEFSLTVIFVSMLLSFMVILLAMYSTIFERTREIGILKSLGASRGFILSMILKESAMICCLGIAFGFLASVAIRKVIMSTFPTLQVEMTARELMQAGILGLLGGTLGGIYPAYRAARQDAVKALSFE